MNVESEFALNFYNLAHTLSNVSPGPDKCTFESVTSISYFFDLFKDLSCRRYAALFSAIVSTFYVVVLISGLFLNLLVIYVVKSKKRMQTVTNFFIVNLAVADLLVSACCVPASLLSNIFIPWILGKISCKLFSYIQGVSVIASALTLFAVNVDRYCAMRRATTNCLSKRQCYYVIILIWVVALIVAIPWLITFELVYFPETGKLPYCHENWSKPLHGEIYFIVVYILFSYLVLVFTMIFFNYSIWKNIPVHHFANNLGCPCNRQAQEETTKKKICQVKMLFCLAIAFFLCYFPLYAVMCRIKFFGNPEQSWEVKAIEITIPFAQLLGSINSCLNPLLYSFYNKKFRKSLASICRDKFCCASKRPVRQSTRGECQNSNVPNPNTLSSLDPVVHIQEADVQQGAVIRSRETQNRENIPFRVFTPPSHIRCSSTSASTTCTPNELRNRNRNVRICTTSF